jgi:RNA polymerase sigma factor (sigma-70 family)
LTSVDEARSEFAITIAAAISGDAFAREAVAERASTLALRTATGALGNRQDGADVAQDVAVDVIRQLASLRDPIAFEAWVHRITVRKTMRALRRRRLRRSREVAVDAGLLLTDPTEVEVSAEALDVRRAVRHAITALPPRQRLAVVLRYVHDLTEAQIADALGCAPGTAASLLSRGRAALRANPDLRQFAAEEGAKR